LFLAPGPAPDSVWFHEPDVASKILFRRAAARPDVCARATANDPVTNFEVFASTFAAHHGFLKHRGVDWASVTRTYRAKVTPATKPEELFAFFSAMIEPLHDAHTFIQARDIKRAFHGKRPETLQLTDAEKRRTIKILETVYLESKLRSWCNGHVRYARLKSGAGYVRVDAFARYTETGGFAAGASALDAALDEIMKDAEGLTGLVIDVRINWGGADPIWHPARGPADRQALRCVRQAHPQRRARSGKLDRPAAIGRPCNRPPPLPQKGSRVNRSRHGQRGGNLHDVHARAPAAHHADRRKHSRRLFRRAGLARFLMAGASGCRMKFS